MLAVSWGIAVPFLRSVFAQRLIIEDDLRWSARGCKRLIRLLSLVLETSKIGRWQFMSYAG